MPNPNGDYGEWWNRGSLMFRENGSRF